MHDVTHVEAHIKIYTGHSWYLKILQIETFQRSLQNAAEIVRVKSECTCKESNPANASEGTLPMQ